MWETIRPPEPRRPMPLTPKQRRFAEEYQIDLNGTQAAIRAGYSARTANRIASENLTKPDIAAEIARLQRERAERLELTADWVLSRLRDEAEDRREGATHAGRIRALEILGKHLGLFRDKLNVEMNGSRDRPVEVQVYMPNNGRDPLPAESAHPQAMTEAERLAAMERMLMAAAARVPSTQPQG